MSTALVSPGGVPMRTTGFFARRFSREVLAASVRILIINLLWSENNPSDLWVTGYSRVNTLAYLRKIPTHVRSRPDDRTKRNI